MKLIKFSCLSLAFILCSIISLNVAFAREIQNFKKGQRLQFRTAEACLPSTSTSNLDINNVRTLLHNGGDMWWDLVSNAKYEVPKVDNPANARHSLFAGSLWIGGTDASGVLRVAAQTYRQSGNDFYPGPLRMDGSTEKPLCSQWDKHFKINRSDIDRFLSEYATGTVSIGNYPAIRDWPTTAEGAKLAPFVDVDNDQTYNPANGDYPKIDGDQAIFWVVNDKGDIHTETKGEQIGVEIQMMAFAFTTSNAVNDMTFYREKVINRSSNTLKDTYIGQWTDADLGYAFDDYVGCDTTRGLGYIYNGDNEDETATGYGFQPPACGIDFFQGPLADPADSIDNDKNGRIDEVGERISMAKFVYYNNDFTITGNPEQASHYYNYLIGKWKNGARMTDDRLGDGNGFLAGSESFIATNYMFPDYSGTSRCFYATQPKEPEWNEAAMKIKPNDRRFIQSAGPFTLLPGAVNEIVIGVVWARDQSNSFDDAQFGSVCKLLQADVLAQALFDNNFQQLQGPDAPFVSIIPFDKELVINWDYSKASANSNNRYENYRQKDPTLLIPQQSKKDPNFEFQGYIVYQLVNDGVSASELSDASKARIVAQCDIKDGITTIVNRTSVPVAGLKEPIIQDEIMVEGQDKGVFHSVKVNQDLFAVGERKDLINYRNYYFAVIAYAQNDTSSDGKQFIIGNRNFNRTVGMPHKTNFEKGGLILNSAYNQGPEITQVAGQGSGGSFLKITDKTEEAILSTGKANNVVYKSGNAPISVQVINPKAVKNMKYRVEVLDTTFEIAKARIVNVDSTSKNDIKLEITKVYVDWHVLNAADNKDTIFQAYFTRSSYDNYLTKRPGRLNGEPSPIIQRKKNGNIVELVDHGIAISVKDVLEAGSEASQATENNGAIGATISFEDSSKAWLSGLGDVNGFDDFNWIRSGPTCTRGAAACNNLPVYYRTRGYNESDQPFVQKSRFYDPNYNYQKYLDGTWSPYCMASHYYMSKDVVGPALKICEDLVNGEARNDQMNPKDIVTLNKLPNIDIVITKDKSKWSRCVVVETSPTRYQGSGAHVMTAKYRKNRDISGNYAPEIPTDTSNYGMSYFPGYAINVDNGERVNIFFGESTWHKEQNGDDMLFNPTNILGSDLKAAYGRHYIYVTNQKYDECKSLSSILRVNPELVVKSGDDKDNPLSYYLSESSKEPSARIDLAYNHVAWTSIAAVPEFKYLFKSYDQIPTNAKVSLRVNKPFPNTVVSGTGFLSAYEFETSALAVVENVQEKGKEALDMVNVVPNPFYGRSGGSGRYEKNQLDSRVKLTNLPQKCSIKIFSLNGSLVRTFRKDSDSPEQEWDLKNDYGVPVASGFYIIHIDGGALGEKSLKFFAVMPQLDLNAY